MNPVHAFWNIHRGSKDRQLISGTWSGWCFFFLQESPLKLDDKVQIIPNHACTMVNQFEEYIFHENGHVMDLWKIDARGMVSAKQDKSI